MTQIFIYFSYIFACALLGETCCEKEGKLYHNFLTSELENDVYVRSVKIGNTTEEDFTKSLTMHPFDQVKKAFFYYNKFD